MTPTTQSASPQSTPQSKAFVDELNAISAFTSTVALESVPRLNDGADWPEWSKSFANTLEAKGFAAWLNADSHPIRARTYSVVDYTSTMEATTIKMSYTPEDAKDFDKIDRALASILRQAVHSNVLHDAAGGKPLPVSFAAAWTMLQERFRHTGLPSAMLATHKLLALRVGNFESVKAFCNEYLDLAGRVTAQEDVSDGDKFIVMVFLDRVRSAPVLSAWYARYLELSKDNRAPALVLRTLVNEVMKVEAESMPDEVQNVTALVAAKGQPRRRLVLGGVDVKTADSLVTVRTAATIRTRNYDQRAGLHDLGEIG